MKRRISLLLLVFSCLPPEKPSGSDGPLDPDVPEWECLALRPALDETYGGPPASWLEPIGLPANFVRRDELEEGAWIVSMREVRPTFEVRIPASVGGARVMASQVRGCWLDAIEMTPRGEFLVADLEGAQLRYFRFEFDIAPESGIDDVALDVGVGIGSTPRDFASPGVLWHYTPRVTSISGEFDLELINVPVGMFVENGIVQWTPGDAQSGSHTIELGATIEGTRTRQTFDLEVAERTLLAEVEIDVAVGGSLTLEDTGTELDGMTLDVAASEQTGMEWLSVYSETGATPSVLPGHVAQGPSFQVHWDGGNEVDLRHSIEALEVEGTGEQVFLASYADDGLHDESDTSTPDLSYVPGPLSDEVSGVVANGVSQLQWVQCPELVTRRSAGVAATYCGVPGSPTRTAIEGYLDVIVGWLEDARDSLSSRGCAVPDPVPVNVVSLDPPTAPSDPVRRGPNGRVRGNAAPIFLNRRYVDTHLGGGASARPESLASTIAHEYVHYVQKALVGTSIYLVENADHERWWVEGTATYEAGRIVGAPLWIEARVPWWSDLVDLGLWYPDGIPNNYRQAAFYSAVDAQTTADICSLIQVRAARPEDVGAYDSHAQWLGGHEQFDRHFALYAAAYNAVRSTGLLRHVDRMESTDATFRLGGYFSLYEFDGEPSEIIHEGEMSGAQTIRIDLTESIGEPGETSRYRVTVEAPSDAFWFVVHDVDTQEQLAEGYPSAPERMLELIPGQRIAITIAHRQERRVALSRHGNEHPYRVRFEAADCAVWTCGDCVETEGCAWCPTDYTVLGLSGSCVPEDEGMCPAPLVTDAETCAPPEFETPECGLVWPHIERPFEQCWTCFTEGCGWTGNVYEGTCVPIEDVEERFDDVCAHLSGEGTCTSDLHDGDAIDCEWCGDFCRSAGRCAEGPAETDGFDVFVACTDLCVTTAHTAELCESADRSVPGGCQWCGDLCMQRGKCEHRHLYDYPSE